MTEELLARLLERVENRYFGKYRGFVVDNADPQLRGRLRVRVPSIFGPEVVTGWALPCAAHGGAAEQGFFFVPEKEAGVWVEFEAGNLEYPIWVGTFWAKPGGKSEVPKPNKIDGTPEDEVQNPPTRKIIKTFKGHTIQLEDKDGEEMLLVVEAKNNHVVVMDKDGIKLTEGTKKHVVAFDKDGIKLTHGENSNEIFVSNDGIKLTDAKNEANVVEMAAAGISVKDKSGNQLALDTQGIGAQDANGNKIEMAAAGVTVEDKAGNKVGLSASGINLDAKGGQLLVDASGVKVGGSVAAHSLVLGDVLGMILQPFITALLTHTHVGNLGAPTSPPVPPLPPVNLNPAFSTKHKIDG